jgi:hypothetical protein
MDTSDWRLVGMLLGLVVVGILAFGLTALFIYWSWMLVAYLIGGFAGALVGAFVQGYHLLM